MRRRGLQHVLEGLPDASVFKLGCTWPLPEKALRSFAESVEALYVVEEASCYLTDAVSALGIDVASFLEPLPRDGELSVGLIRAAFGFPEPAHAAAQADVPGRPPALCPGCPHRLVFKELSRCKAIVTGDIGCYTLGALPLSAMDTPALTWALLCRWLRLRLCVRGVSESIVPSLL